MWATKIMLNPNVDVANQFKNSIFVEGLQNSHLANIYPENTKSSEEEDFLKNNTRTTIDKLYANEEARTFVVMARVNELVEDGPWWYPACRCGRSVIPDAGVYFCDHCNQHVFNMTPRFKLKVEVEDSTGIAIFVLFERECMSLFKKSCAEIFAENMKDPENVRNNVLPTNFSKLCNKKMLFKIETKVVTPNRYHGTFCVKRICEDNTFVEMFSLPGSEKTPTKVMTRNAIDALTPAKRNLFEDFDAVVESDGSKKLKSVKVED